MNSENTFSTTVNSSRVYSSRNNSANNNKTVQQWLYVCLYILIFLFSMFRLYRTVYRTDRRPLTGYSALPLRWKARDLLYALSHVHENTKHGLC